MFKTKVEWEACVGENRLQFSIFSGLSRCSLWDPGEIQSRMSKHRGDVLFCQWNTNLHISGAIIIAHTGLYSVNSDSKNPAIGA